MQSRWIIISALLIQTANAQTAADWPAYNRDLAATRYSALKQINASNAAKLAQAWSYRLRPDTNSPPAGTMNEVTPIVVNGVCIFPREIASWRSIQRPAPKSGATI